METVECFAFVENPTETKPKIGNPQEFIAKKFSARFGFGSSDMSRLGVYREGGWQFDFRPLLTKYVVKDYYSGLAEYYAPNKTTLRRYLGGRIKYIIKIEQ